MNADERRSELASIRAPASLQLCLHGTQPPNQCPIHTRPPIRKKKSAFIGVHPRLKFFLPFPPPPPRQANRPASAAKSTGAPKREPPRSQPCRRRHWNHRSIWHIICSKEQATWLVRDHRLPAPPSPRPGAEPPARPNPRRNPSPRRSSGPAASWLSTPPPQKPGNQNARPPKPQFQRRPSATPPPPRPQKQSHRRFPTSPSGAPLHWSGST